MLVLNDYKKIDSKGLAVTIGKFDGVHLGHRKLLNCLMAEKGELQSCIFTFVFEGEFSKVKNPICSAEEKEAIFEKIGIDYCLEYPFSKEIMNQSPYEFAKNILCEGLKCKLLVVGDDFRFGKDRAGDINMLSELSVEFGFRLIVVPREEYEGEPISSTRIRREISQQNLEKVDAMLGKTKQ